MTRPAVIVASLLLASCNATTNWTKPGASDAMLETDKAKCHYEAEFATAPIRDAIEAGVKEGFMEVACLRAKGWVSGG